MRREDEPRGALHCEVERRNCFADARVLGDFAAFERDVEIDADEDALARHLEIADGEFGHRVARLIYRPGRTTGRTAGGSLFDAGKASQSKKPLPYK